MSAENGRHDNTQTRVNRAVENAVEVVEKQITRKWIVRIGIVTAFCTMVGAVVSVVALGAKGQAKLDAKADAAFVSGIERRTTELEAHHQDDQIHLERIESKLDRILGIVNPRWEEKRRSK